MAFHKFIQNFNAGELSPFLANRTDVAKYESGCQLLENFILLPYGGVMRRPGTQYLGKAKFPDKPCRLIGFNFSVTTNFILELGEKYIRYWTNGQQVVVPILTYAAWVTAHAYALNDRVRTGTPQKVYKCIKAHTSGVFATDLANKKWEANHPPLEDATPYTAAQVRDIQYCQINDLMYMCHPDYPVYKLTRNADDDWTYAELAYKWPPLQDENIKNITVTPSATGGNISISASSGIFSADDVGSTWQIGHNMAGNLQTYLECPLGNVNGYTSGIRVRGGWTLTTFGTWSGELRIVRTTYITGITETIRTYHNAIDGQRNISTTGNEDNDCVLYIQFITAGSAGSSNPMARLEFANAVVYGLVKITSFSSATLVYGTVTWGMAQATATTRWSEPAFNKKWGYARTACLHETRLILGGSRKKPLSIHGSQIDDYENFQRGALADHAFRFNLSANESNPINWMVSQTALLVGTAGNEWSVNASDETQAIGPGNVQAKQQSSFGSSFLQARVVNEVILFAQRQSHKIRELVYSFEKDGWVAPDLTILAAHIAGEGFAETAFAQQPDAIYWATNKSGELVGMTYERDQNVVGWHRHTTDGKFESVAAIYGGEKADEIWFSVQREAAEFVAPYWTAGTVYNDGEYVSISNVPYAGPHAGEAPPDRTTYKCLVDHTSAHFGNDLVAGKWVQEDIEMKPVRYIERFDPNFRPTLEAEDKISYWYLDCGFRSGGETKVGEISGVGHLEGRTVGVLGDGANQPTREVIGGKVDIQDPAKLILVGLPFISVVKPMNLNIPADDTTQGRKFRIHKLVVRFHKSLTCKFSTDGVKWDEIFFRDRDDKMDSSPSVYSGDREVHTNANFKQQQAVSIRQDRPFPCCVLAMIYWADAYGE